MSIWDMRPGFSFATTKLGDVISFEFKATTFVQCIYILSFKYLP
jgi:hypothetical protein